MNKHHNIDMTQRSRRILTDLRVILKPMTMKQRMEFLDTKQWLNFFNNMSCPREILSMLEDDIIEMYLSGETYEKIFNKLGVTKPNVHRVVKQHNLPLSRKTHRKLSKEDVFYIYDNPTISIGKLSKKYDVSEYCILNCRRGDTYKEFYDEYYK